ncbi:MAG: apolipoprotein N-acyltransferase [Bdellovibrionales bacterium]|nr:apolipoprotein N-acyltransferase [Bdellovibrionales bacterium]
MSGWLTSFVLTIIGFNWMTYLFHEFANMPWPVAFVAMLAFAAIAHFYVPLIGALWFLGKKRFHWSDRHSLILLVLLTCTIEYFYWTLFKWNFGYTWFAYHFPIYHLAEWIGFSGLSALTLAANGLFFLIWRDRTSLKGKIYLATTIGIFIALNGLGLWVRSQLPAPDRLVRPLLVQANIGNLAKKAVELGHGFRDDVLQKYLALTKSGVEKARENLDSKAVSESASSRSQRAVDFAMWPETAFPASMGENFRFRRHPQLLRQFQYDLQLPMVIGAYSRDPKNDLATNSLFSLNQDGEFEGPYYSKTILLMFGEYIPLESYYPKIRDWLPPTGHFSPGPGPNVLLKQGELKLGPQICYESLFANFSRKLAQQGAQVIVNVTNDSWYGTWQEPYQHMYMTLARAVEFRRPVLRVTNTGFSTVALADGTILERSPLRQEWFGLYDVPYLENPPETFYQKWFWLVPSVLIFLLLFFLFRGWREQRSGIH